MFEFRTRVFLAFLVAGLLGIALVNMVVDRRAFGAGGRELPWWSGFVLDLAVPVQKMVSVPFDFARDHWAGYTALVGVRDVADPDEGDLRQADVCQVDGRPSRSAGNRRPAHV